MNYMIVAKIFCLSIVVQYALCMNQKDIDTPLFIRANPVEKDLEKYEFINDENSQEIDLQSHFDWSNVDDLGQVIVVFKEIREIAKEICPIYEKEASCKAENISNELVSNKKIIFSEKHVRTIVFAGKEIALNLEQNFLNLIRKLPIDFSEKITELRCDLFEKHINYKSDEPRKALSCIKKYCNALLIMLDRIIENAEKFKKNK